MINISYLQLPNIDLTFEMRSTIDDFGLDLYTFDAKSQKYSTNQSVIVSNKKICPDNEEHQFEIKVRKRPEQYKDIEFDIELKANPLLLLYHKEFFKRAILLSKIGLNEET